MITLEGVGYAYPDSPSPTLRDVDWSLAAGSVALVGGLSGSGKSTLLRVVNGLVPHFAGGRFAGRVRVAGRDPVALGPAGMADTVGFVFQEPEAQAVVTVVEEEIAFGLEQQGVARPIMRRRVEEVLDLLGIAALRRRPLSSLSGGERQRVALAAVLASQPPVLVLDEPTSQLDPLGAEEVLTALERLNADLGLTILLAEHRLERVIGYADRLVWLPGEGQSVLDRPLREGLAQLPLPVPALPPLIQAGRQLGWQPLPVTIREGRRWASRHRPAPLTPTPPPTSGTPALLRLNGVTFGYERQPILSDLELAIGPGELVALMGRNGSGKTTLLRLLMGLLRPARGEIMLAGRSTRGLTPAAIAQQVAYLPQRASHLLLAETVRAELALGRPPGTADSTVDQLLATFELTHLADRYPRDASIGEQQRIALAAMTGTDTRLLLLDEPTRGLDAMAKISLANQLRQHAATGRSIVLVTHDVELVATWASRVIMLGDGEVIADGSPHTVLAGSLTFAPQINRLFGGSYLRLSEVVGHD